MTGVLDLPPEIIAEIIGLSRKVFACSLTCKEFRDAIGEYFRRAVFPLVLDVARAHKTLDYTEHYIQLLKEWRIKYPKLWRCISIREFGPAGRRERTIMYRVNESGFDTLSIKKSNRRSLRLYNGHMSSTSHSPFERLFLDLKGRSKDSGFCSTDRNGLVHWNPTYAEDFRYTKEATWTGSVITSVTMDEHNVLHVYSLPHGKGTVRCLKTGMVYHDVDAVGGQVLALENPEMDAKVAAWKKTRLV